MDYLEDSALKDVWRHHFHKRGHSEAARLLLMTLIEIIKERSGAVNRMQTATAAQRFGIPAKEWNQLEAEL